MVTSIIVGELVGNKQMQFQTCLSESHFKSISYDQELF